MDGWMGGQGEGRTDGMLSTARCAPVAETKQDPVEFSKMRMVTIGTLCVPEILVLMVARAAYLPTKGNRATFCILFFPAHGKIYIKKKKTN